LIKQTNFLHRKTTWTNDDRIPILLINHRYVYETPREDVPPLFI